ncbi:MAG: protein kinase [Parachlamydiaceae bacterium]|nr:protein kinase [Parachlamydiaceae bacterium]
MTSTNASHKRPFDAAFESGYDTQEKTKRLKPDPDVVSTTILATSILQQESKLSIRSPSPLTRTAIYPLLLQNEFDNRVKMIRAHSVLMTPSPIDESTAIQQLRKMMEPGQDFNLNFRKALAIPSESEKKEMISEKTFSAHCHILLSLAPYLINELGKQKQLPPLTMRAAIILSLQRIENYKAGHFKVAEIAHQVFFCGFVDQSPVILFHVKPLGSGTYGNVCSVIEVSENAKPDQLKALKRSKIDSYRAVEEEIANFKRTKKTPGLLQMDYSFDVTLEDAPFKCYVAPLCESLHNTIHQKLSIKNRLKLALQLSQATIALLHKGIYHRDIKPENILHRNKHVLFSDLMDLSYRSDTKNFHFFVGTHHYQCPEMVKRLDKVAKDKIASMRVECLEMNMSYSCASVMYEIFTARRPRPLRDDLYHDLNHEIDEKALQGYAPELIEMMKGLLHKDPDKRLYKWITVFETLQKAVAA